MGADDGAVEHLNRMRGLAEPLQHGEIALEHPHFAEPVEALTNAFSVPEPLGQRTPGDVVDYKIVKRFEEEPLVLRLRALRRKAGEERLQRQIPIDFVHLRGHRRQLENSSISS